jgi:hypothetical protein
MEDEIYENHETRCCLTEAHLNFVILIVVAVVRTSELVDGTSTP